MRKFFIAFLIFSLLTAGAVQAASFSSSAVKTLISRTLTKVCPAANDNRCLRLVSGGSQLLTGAVAGATLLFGKNWLGLALTFLLPLVGDYVFNLGEKTKVSVTKSNDTVIVTQVEKTGGNSDIPVVQEEGISATPGYSNQSVAGNIAANGMDNTVIGGNYVYHDPKTARVTTYGGFTAAAGQYHPTGSLFVSSVKDAQKYQLLSWSAGDNLVVYGLSNGVFASSTVRPDYWYFTNGNIVSYFTLSSYVGRFSGYMSPMIWVKDGVKTAAYYLIGYSGFPQTTCGEGEYFDYSASSCHAIAEQYQDYSSSKDVNATVREEQSAPVVTTPNVPLKDWLETLTEAEKEESSTELLADFIDKLWEQTAAQPEYEGVPYREGVITPGLIGTVSPAPPKIGDLLQPIETVVSPGAGIQPGTTLTPDTGTGDLTDKSTDPVGGIISPTVPGTGTGTIMDGNLNIDVSLDLGDYPAVNQPVLEDIPTAANILDPIFNLFPGLRNYQVPDHASECPRPSFEAFGETYEVGYHCDFLEVQKETIAAFMMLMWSITALAIVLKA